MMLLRKKMDPLSAVHLRKPHSLHCYIIFTHDRISKIHKNWKLGPRSVIISSYYPHLFELSAENWLRKFEIRRKFYELSINL